MKAAMSLSMQLKQQIKQEMTMAQIIEFSNLMTIPDDVLNAILGAVSFNPESIEVILESHKKEKNRPGADNKVQSIYTAMISQKGNTDNARGGMIIAPEVGGLETCLKGDIQFTLTPDVTYIGRVKMKPEIVFSDHLQGRVGLYMLQLDISRYPEITRLLSQLRRFDDWKRSKLREAYTLLGERQRKFIATLDRTDYNVFHHNDLAKNMELSGSTISRILCNRWVEVRGTSGERLVLRSKDFFVTEDDLKRYNAIPLLNKTLYEEFEKRYELKRALSDDELTARIPPIARRTLSKYRAQAGIPNALERTKAYRKGRDKPYVVL